MYPTRLLQYADTVYTFGRLAGHPGSSDAYDGYSFDEATTGWGIGKAPISVDDEFGWADFMVLGGSTQLLRCPVSYHPEQTNNNELGNGGRGALYEPDPTEPRPDTGCRRVTGQVPRAMFNEVPVHRDAHDGNFAYDFGIFHSVPELQRGAIHREWDSESFDDWTSTALPRWCWMMTATCPTSTTGPRPTGVHGAAPSTTATASTCTRAWAAPTSRAV